MEIIKTHIPEFIIENNILNKYENNDLDIKRLQDDILSKFNEKNSVILVGQVQSGKTNFVINLIHEALYGNNYQYDAIIYFTGMNNELNNQTLERLLSGKEKEFSNVVTTSELDTIRNINKLVIVSIKQITNSDNIKKFISSYSDSIKKILIIDDESDYGAINTKSKEETLNNEASPVYKEIYDSMYKLCVNSGGFLKLTATPFVNILTEKDYYKEKDPYLFSIPTKEDYTGVKFFNDNKNKFWYTIIKDTQYEPYDIENCKIDVIKSFFIWIYKSYLLYQDKNVKNYNKSDLLINVSFKKKEHETLEKILSPYVWLNKKFKLEMQKFLNDELGENLNENMIDDIYNFYSQIVIKDEIRLYKFNSEEKDRSIKNYNIIIGGHLLSRGKSFDNLLCELIVIKEKSQLNYDSLLQKCRWFGYRKSRDKYMAVICNEKIKNKLKKVEIIVNMFHDKNLGYELNYKEILKTLRKWDKLFEDDNYTISGKIKYGKEKSIHSREY